MRVCFTLYISQFFFNFTLCFNRFIHVAMCRPSVFMLTVYSIKFILHFNYPVPFGESFRKKRKKVKSLSCVQFFATPVAYQAPLSMGFFRQEYWTGLPFPSPGDLPTEGLNPGLMYCRQMLYPLSHQSFRWLLVFIMTNSAAINILHVSAYTEAQEILSHIYQGVQHWL